MKCLRNPRPLTSSRGGGRDWVQADAYTGSCVSWDTVHCIVRPTSSIAVTYKLALCTATVAKMYTHHQHKN